MTGVLRCCRRCGQFKPRSEFLKDKTGRDGLRASCRVCDAAARKAKRPTRKELASALRQATRYLAAANPESSLLPALRDFLKRI